MILCPKCGGKAEYNSYHNGYRCLQCDCTYFKSQYDLTDEDKIYFNRQERYDRWELDEPVKDLCFMENSMDVRIKWKDDMVQCLSLEDILKAICKAARKEIRAIK